MPATPTHAIVVTVTFKPGLEETASDMLETQVVPAAQAAPGFVAGYWLHGADGRTGTSVELFDSRANAEAELGRRSTEMPPESPVTVDSAAVFAVVASA